MSLPHRIAAGAVVIHQQRVLLVRYAPSSGGTYLVAPGGGVHDAEPFGQAAERETLEETGVIVAARHVLAVEDLLCSRYRMCKTWFYCELVSGEPHPTEGAKLERITQAAWFTREQLSPETVYPSILTQYDWSQFASPQWTPQWMELRRASF